MSIRIVGHDEPWPGPLWQPFVYDGRYPITEGDAGDIYINRYKDPPLYYVFYRRGYCELVDREDIRQWVTGGLMMLPTPVHTELRPGTRPSQRQFSNIAGQE